MSCWNGGTLLLDNVQMLTSGDRDRLTAYLKSGTLTRPPAAGEPLAPTSSPPSVTAGVRLVLASPQPFNRPGLSGHALKLFPLAQRKDDIPAFAQQFLDQFCREQGRPPLQLDQGDWRRLISYAYPGNLSELAGILKRAVLMTPPDQTVIPESVLWSVQSEKNAFRIDLLNQVPWLRPWLLSDWWPQGVWLVMMALFIPVTLIGFVGPQTRESSLTLNFFLGLVVARLPVSIRVRGSSLVRGLSVYDYRRMVAAVFPLAVAPAIAALADPLVEPLGSLGAVCGVWGDLPVGASVGFAPSCLLVGLAIGGDYRRSCDRQLDL